MTSQHWRWVSPPGWPAPPPGWEPPPGWQPDPAWPAAPLDWQFWQPLDVGAAGTVPHTGTPPAVTGERGWFARHKLMTGLGLGAVLLVALAAVGSSGSDSAGGGSAGVGSDARPFVASEYATLSPQELGRLVKDPQAHEGDRVVLFGHVSQFDAATGTGTFRADVGAAQLPVDEFYDYDVNAVLRGDEALLDPVVQDDLVKVFATATGSLTYDTQIGGSTTVPAFRVDRIEVVGHVD